MKNKIVLYLAISLLIPSYAIGQNIKVVIFNKTGFNLDSVSFNRIYLGNIPKDSTVVLSNLSEIIMQGDVPLHLPFGIIEGKKRPVNLLVCATKSNKKKDGIYMFDILLYERDNEYRLYWRKQSEVY